MIELVDNLSVCERRSPLNQSLIGMPAHLKIMQSNHFFTSHFGHCQSEDAHVYSFQDWALIVAIKASHLIGAACFQNLKNHAETAQTDLSNKEMIKAKGFKISAFLCEEKVWSCGIVN